MDAPATAQEPETTFDEQPIPWQIRLGLRAATVERAFPVVDRVVLVPDAATYLRELTRWSPAGRWPVLIEDDQLAPMFIRRFRPAEVIRADAARPLPEGLGARRSQVEYAVVSAWGGTPGAETSRTVFQRHGHVPPGVVLASTNDPAWTAAAALAAGRGQPIAWMDGGLGRPNATLDAVAASRLRRRVSELAAQPGYTCDAQGDEIDAITICRTMAGKAENPFPLSVLPDLPAEQRAGPLAITDILGRNDAGERFAITGWIFGDETRCTYMAMCSLFLPRERTGFYNAYPAGEPWSAYDGSEPATALGAQGFTTSYAGGAQMNEVGWRRMIAGGFSSDMIVMTSKGGADAFDLTAGRGSAHDVPILNTPAALFMVHSWSMRSPENRSTVGGRWLERGVYAYVGSVHEPFLSAFVTPMELVERCVNYSPFLVAGRHYAPHPFGQPWKVNTIGDPLMLVAPPGKVNVERITLPREDGTNVGEHVKTLMRSCASGADGSVFAETIAALDLLGRDEIAVQIWSLAERQGCTPETARAALGPLFRLRDDTAFMRAWSLVRTPDAEARDMLWHLMGPKLHDVEDHDLLMQLQSAIRRPQAWVDVGTLSPHLARVFGGAYARGFIERELKRTQAEGARKRLQALLQRYPAPASP
jgi:hypothetical protein